MVPVVRRRVQTTGQARRKRRLRVHSSSGAKAVTSTPPAETKPLLHLWSLSIEEQFYLIWPVLLWVVAKRRVNLLLTTTVLALASFALATYELRQDAVAAFFLPQYRAWELLLGAIVAQRALSTRGFELPRVGRSNVQSVAGMTLIALAVAFTPRNAFPGWWALMPTVEPSW